MNHVEGAPSGSAPCHLVERVKHSLLDLVREIAIVDNHINKVDTYNLTKGHFNLRIVF